MWFSTANMALTPRRPPVSRCPGPGCLAMGGPVPGAGAWALVLPLSIAVVVGAIAVLPTTADVLTWIALLLVPAGAALALGWGGPRRPALAGGPALLCSRWPGRRPTSAPARPPR